MICKRCGTNIQEGMPCACGMPSACGMSSGGPYSSNPAVNLIKQFGASKMFFAIVLLTTMGVVVTFIHSFTYSAQELFTSGFEQFPELYQRIHKEVNTVANLFSVFSFFPQVIRAITVIGLWFFHISCKDISSEDVKVTGLILIRVAQTIILVLLCVVFCLFFIFFFFVLKNLIPADSFSSIETIVLFVILLAIFAAVFAIFIFYQATILRTVICIRKVCKNGVIHKNISLFLIVMNYILAGYSILVMIPSLTTNLLSTLNSLLYVASLILPTLLLSAYRKEAKKIMHPQPTIPLKMYADNTTPIAPAPVDSQPATPMETPIQPENADPLE